jgi:hypothetical protein
MPNRNVRMRTILQFRVQDVTFRRADGTIIPRSSPLAELHQAASPTLWLNNQKNGQRGATIYHEANLLAWLSPGKALARRVASIISFGVLWRQRIHPAKLCATGRARLSQQMATRIHFVNVDGGRHCKKPADQNGRYATDETPPCRHGSLGSPVRCTRARTTTTTRTRQRGCRRTAAVWGNCLWGVGLAIDFKSPSRFSFIGPFVLQNLAESQVTTSESEFRDGVCTPRTDKHTLWQTEAGLSGGLESSALDTRKANAHSLLPAMGSNRCYGTLQAKQ